MRWMAVRSNVVAVALFGFAATGCDAITGGKKSFTISANPLEFTLGQGATLNVAVTIDRKNFDKPVTLSVEGPLPAGLSATFSVNPVPNGTNTTTLTVTAAGSANPGPTTLTVRANGEGVSQQTVNVDVTVDITGTYALELLNPSLTVAQGGGASATVLLTRSGGNAAGVSLSVSGAPSGVTTAFSQSPTSDRGAGLAITASASVAPGSYPLEITSTSPGFADQNTSLSLVVISPPSTAAASLAFCADDMPTWFAYQNEGFEWQRVTATGTTFSFSATSKVAVAYAFVVGNESQVNIYYATRNELLGITDRDCDGTKTLTGTVSGLTSGQSAIVVMGGNGTSTSSSNFTLQEIASRPLDLVATRGTISLSGQVVPDKLIVRRALNLTTNSVIPVLDFTAAESFAPEQSTLTITGFASGSVIQFQNNFWSSTSTYGTIQTGEAAGGSTNLFSVPSAQHISGDMHELFIDSFNSSSTVGAITVSYFGAPGNRTEALGPTLTQPTVSLLTGSPYGRMRGQLASQAEYPTAVRFVYLQGTTARKFVVLVATAAHLGGRPNTWDVLIPDFTGTPGFSATWMLSASQTSTPFSAEAFSAREDVLFGAVPTIGEFVKFGYRVSNTSSLLRELRAPGPRERRSPLVTQYLRR